MNFVTSMHFAPKIFFFFLSPVRLGIILKVVLVIESERCNRFSRVQSMRTCRESADRQLSRGLFTADRVFVTKYSSVRKCEDAKGWLLRTPTSPRGRCSPTRCYRHETSPSVLYRNVYDALAVDTIAASMECGVARRPYWSHRRVYGCAPVHPHWLPTFCNVIALGHSYQCTRAENVNDLVFPSSRR